MTQLSDFDVSNGIIRARSGEFAGRAATPGTLVQTSTDADLLTEYTDALSPAVGFQYRAEIFPANGDVVAAVAGAYSAQFDMLDDELKENGSAAEILAALAIQTGFDVTDEYSYDTDEFPKTVTEDQVTIAEHPALGREFWSFPGYDDEPRTADSALQEWMDTQEIDFNQMAHRDDAGSFDPDFNAEEEEENLRAMLFQFTNRTFTAKENIEAIAAGAQYMGIDLDKLGYPLPAGVNTSETE